MLNMKKIALTLLVAVAAVSVANAAVVIKGTAPTEDANATVITESETWTSDNIYELHGQVVFADGATLTIEAGTVVRGAQTPEASGAICIARGAKIYVQGTKDNPVVMTAYNDTDPSDPDYGKWKAQVEQWGNLTILGKGIISASDQSGGTKIPDGTQTAQMEGLTPATGQNWADYGGNDDDDDSGSISYLSLRYGGRVIGEADELNGLSLGGVGRETDIHHIEIMNNVDDGIEIWGGAVNLKYVAIWNIGDDSFDLDQGWRGKAQFGLIVQGYGKPGGKSGSGFADRCFEMDGAEDPDAQPVTTTRIENFTVIGQADADDATGWRDNVRVQFNNCVFVETGDLVDHGNSWGGGIGGNILSWTQCWTTDADDATAATSGYNMGGVAYSTLYKSQDPDGKLCQMTGSVFYNIGDFFEAVGTGGDNVNVVEDIAPGLKINNNVIRYPGTDQMPIAYLERSTTKVEGSEGTDIYPVVKLDPRARNDANSNVNPAPADGFFTPAPYRGAFSPTHNWCLGWTAADEYGMFVDVPNNDVTPEATAEIAKIQMNTTFQTESGVYYTVEKSSDMKNWSPVKTVVGDGTEMSVEDLDDFDSAKFYRVVRQ